MHPTTAPTRAGRLTLDDGQTLRWEESGTPHGVPAIDVHGGPGSGLRGRGWARRVDPARFRVIGFDQRGCGRSTPLATDPAHDLAANTTARLVADMEALREHLEVEAWVLHSASWGTTLALAYAQAHPDRVLGLVLVAVTTTSRREVEWVTETVGAVYPEAWDRLAAHAEAAGIGYRRGEGRLVEAYARLLADPDPQVRAAAVRAWGEWEDTHVSIGAGGVHRDPRWADPVEGEVVARLVTHYWAHDGFCDPPLLDRVDRVAHLPATLVHGRLDVSGPLVTAWELHRRWPGSELVVVEGDGHGGAAMADAWTAALDRLADRLEVVGGTWAPRPGPARS